MAQRHKKRPLAMHFDSYINENVHTMVMYIAFISMSKFFIFMIKHNLLN
jgi:hypothetical protein